MNKRSTIEQDNTNEISHKDKIYQYQQILSDKRTIKTPIMMNNMKRTYHQIPMNLLILLNKKIKLKLLIICILL